MNHTEQVITDYLRDKGPAPYVWLQRDLRELPSAGMTFALDMLVREGRIKTEDIWLPDGLAVRVFVHPEGKPVDLGDGEWVLKMQSDV